MNGAFLGLDLGQAKDYTALVVVELVEGELVGQKPYHHLRHIERFPLGTPYPSVVERVNTVMESVRFSRKQLVVDATGVGAAIVDLLREARLRPVGVIITGGNEAIRDEEDNTWKTPKRDLVGVLQVLFQTGRLKIAEGLPEARLLVDEFLNLQVKITEAGRDTYGTWREGDHDDLVLATALACWYAEKVGGRPKSGPGQGIKLHGWAHQEAERRRRRW